MYHSCSFRFTLDCTFNRRNIPPSVLLRNAKRYSQGALLDYVPIARYATSMQTLPSWAVAPTASTDWSLIQKAKAAREAQLSPMSDASTPTSSPLASKRFFFTGTSSSSSRDKQGKTTHVATFTSSSYQIALDAAGLGGPMSNMDAFKSIHLWKMVLCLLGLTAAVSVGMVVLMPEDEIPSHHALPHSSPVPIGRSAVWNQATGRFERSISKATRNIHTQQATGRPSSSNALVPTSIVYDNAVAPPTVSRAVSSMMVRSENAFVHGMSFVGSSVGPIFKPTPREDEIVDLDTTEKYTAAHVSMKQRVKARRLHRLGDIISGALPSMYYV